MTQAAPNHDIVVEPATEADSADALRLLFGRPAGSNIDDILPESGINNADAPDSLAVPGLFCATNVKAPHKIVGVIWARHAMPGIHSIWQPVSRPQSPVVEHELYQTLAAFLDRTPCRLARALTEPGSPFETRLSKIGFRRQTDIVSRLWHPAAVPDGWLTEDYSVSELQPGGDEEFIGIMERSYQQSLDCPDLVKLLTAKDLLEFYRANTFATKSSFFLLFAKSVPAGCLVLTEDLDNESLELTYMGVEPAQRGKGLGKLLVNFAKEKACEMKYRRLVVAVDCSNKPAWDIYEQAGFVTYSSQSLMIRTA